MKKALIPATLVLTATLVPCVSTVVGWGNNSLIAGSLVSSLFWRVVDTIRERELTRLISGGPGSGQTAAPTEPTAAPLAPIAVAFVLGHVLPAAGDHPA
jgi:hypothetical protein